MCVYCAKKSQLVKDEKRTQRKHFFGFYLVLSASEQSPKEGLLWLFRQIIAICRGRGRVLLRRERPAATGLGCGLARIFSSRQWICDDRDSFSLPIPATRRLNRSTNEMAQKAARVSPYDLVQTLRKRSESRNHFFSTVFGGQQ